MNDFPRSFRLNILLDLVLILVDLGFWVVSGSVLLAHVVGFIFMIALGQVIFCHTRSEA